MKNKAPLLYWIILGVTTAIFIYIRLRLLSLPLERDEGEYAYGGQLILGGYLPYKDIYTMKLPGVYYFYSAFIFLMGSTITAIRMGGIIVNLLTAFMVLKTGEALLNRGTGMLAAAGFMALSAAPRFLGITDNTEVFVNLFTITSGYFLLRWVNEGKPLLIFFAGVSAALACLMKQHAIFILAVDFFVLLLALSFPRRPLWSWVTNSLLLAGGFVSIMLALLFSVFLSGTWSKFIWLTVKYAGSYISHDTFSNSFLRFLSTLAVVINNNHITWTVVLAGIFISYRALAKREFFILLFWLIASFAGVFPGYYFREHYFLLLLPVTSLYFGIALNFLFEWSAAKSGVLKMLPVALFALCLIYFLVGERRIFFSFTPSEVSASMYKYPTFNEAIEVGNYVRRNTKAGEKVLVVGSEPEIYFYSRRKGATPYIYEYPLIENHLFRDSMVHEFLQQSAINKPSVIIDCRDRWSSAAFHDSMLAKLLSVRPGYALKGFCYQDKDGNDVFAWNNNEINISKQKIVWEIYALVN